MLQACKSKGCQLYVNYPRRSEPGVLEVKRRLVGGRIACPVRGVVWYSKGLFNNGSHFFNLLEFWLGGMSRFKIIESGRHVGKHADPEPDLHVTFRNGAVDYLAVREEWFSHHEVNLVAPNGCLRYEQGGRKIGWQEVVPDLAVPSYSVLSDSIEIIATESARSQWHVVDQLAACLDGLPGEICTGTEALQTIEALTNIRAQL